MGSLIIFLTLKIFAVAAATTVLEDSSSISQCFVHGECIDSFTVEILVSSDEFECLEFCQNNEECQWFTFFPDNQVCQLCENCTALETEHCPNCISGETSCEATEPVCWVEGQCEGQVLFAEEVSSANECLQLCKSEKNCGWFTYLISGATCFLLEDCVTLDESSEASVSGERHCEVEVESTTSTQIPTTTKPQTGFSKVLIVHGYNSGLLNAVEIIDLMSSTTTCQPMPNHPTKSRFSAGGLFDQKPLLCGGDSNGVERGCFILEDGAWKESHQLTEGRFSYAMTNSPFPDDKNQLFLSGGYNSQRLQTTEVLTETGWKFSVPLPVELNFHCMVQLNSTSVMVIGGNEGNDDIPAPKPGRTFVFNSETGFWSEGPRLLNKRDEHPCSLIRKNDQTLDNSVIVVGGDVNGISNLVEVLDPNSDVWRSGPDLPQPICCSALVQDPSGGVILMGGGNNDQYLNKLYKLPHAGDYVEWELLPQKMKIPRAHFTAFLVPDEIANCTEKND